MAHSVPNFSNKKYISWNPARVLGSKFPSFRSFTFTFTYYWAFSEGCSQNAQKVRNLAMKSKGDPIIPCNLFEKSLFEAKKNGSRLPAIEYKKLNIL